MSQTDMQIAIRNFNKAVAEVYRAFRKSFLEAWGIYKDVLIYKKQKAEERRAQIKHMRKSWRIRRDTRQRSQVLDRRPTALVRRINM